MSSPAPFFGFDYGITCMKCQTKRDYDERIDEGESTLYLNRKCRQCDQTWILEMTYKQYKLLQKLEKQLE